MFLRRGRKQAILAENAAAPTASVRQTAFVRQMESTEP
jgi:hypothetical protein